MHIIELAPLFKNNMVFQRNKPIRVWGRCLSKDEIKIEFNGRKYYTFAENDLFSIELEQIESACNLELIVSCGQETTIIKNIAVGEVWLAAGQSNMELKLRHATNGLFNMQFETSDIRCVNVADDNMQWKNVKDTDGIVSGVAYYFASLVAQKTNVPIGIVECNKGATSIFHWLPVELTLNDEITNIYVKSNLKFYGEYDGIEDFSIKMMGNSFPKPYGYFYENYFKKVIPYSVKGVLWYQGESDATGKETAKVYLHAYKILAARWRRDMRDNTLPFITVILAKIAEEWTGGATNDMLCYLREAQLTASREIENVYTVNGVDCGLSYNIHPCEKKTIGERMAGCALSEVYGYDVKWRSPEIKRIEICDKKLLVYLKYTYGRINVSYFMISGFQIEDIFTNKYEPTGKIVDEHIELDLRENPIRNLKYCFINDPDIFIFNKYGLPLMPFNLDII